MDSNLDALMARYQAGDLAAARLLIGEISPRLHRYFESQTRSRTDADDLLQEAWLRIHRVRHTYRSGQPVLPWVYAISRRVRLDHYRKTARRRGREERWEDLSESVAGAPADGSRVDELQELLAPLSDSQREVLEMMKIAGMTLEEVARATSCTVGSVKQKVHRAYQTLRMTMSLDDLKSGQTGANP
jgi:RNA polymerase sigma-70 factor, ECF subfamily